MKWVEFQENYLIEVNANSYIDVQFAENTPLFAIGEPRISKIFNVRVLDKKTMKTVREYPIQMDWEEIRSVQNKLRKLLIRDFQIVETGLPPRFSELKYKEPEFLFAENNPDSQIG